MMLKLLISASLLVLCSAHVRLTFPEARKYDLDFLDNARTIGACGMWSNDGSPMTTFAAGQVVNITWHLAYSHRGGHRLELLNPTTEAVEYSLTPSNRFLSQDDTTVTIQEVMIPSDAHGRYTLRLLRQASEWGGWYLFRSCADIKVEDYSPICNADMHCSGRGTCMDGMCDCDHLAFGDYCQYQDDCESPSDCNNNGVCVEVSRTSYPRRQCFCNSRHFGHKCEHNNPDDFGMDVKTSGYQELMLNGESGDFTLRYKVLEELGEIEFVMDIRGSTWMAVGWRPTGLDTTCQNWPVPYRSGGGSTMPHPQPTAEGEPEPTPTAEGEPEPTPTAKGEPEPTPTAAGEPEPTPAAEGEPEPTPAAGGEPEPTPAAEGEPEPTPTAEGEPEPTSEPPASGKRRRRRRQISNDVIDATMQDGFDGQWHCPSPDGPEPTGEPEWTPDPDSEPEPEHTPEPTGEPERTPDPNSEPEPEHTPEPTGEPEWTPDPNSEPEPEHTPEPTGEPEWTPDPNSEPEPEHTPEPTGEPEWTPDPNSEPEPEHTPEPTGEPEWTPDLNSEPEPEHTPEPTGEPEWTPDPNSEPEPEHTPEPTGEPEWTPDPNSEPEPEHTPEPTGEPEWTPDPNSEPEPEHTPEPTGEPEWTPDPNSEPEPEHTPEPTGEPEWTPDPHSEPEPEHTPEPTGEPEWTPDPHSEPEPSSEPHAEPTPTAEGEPEPQPGGSGSGNPPGRNPHAMDCTDMVIGKVMQTYSHVGDYYTRDRATPRLDGFWGGTSDITAAGGQEYGDRSRLVFRKKLQSRHESDHSINIDEAMHVIWAHGQEYCKYFHRPNSGYEAMTAKDAFFYPRYELKYHGTHALNRGQFGGLTLYSSSTEPPACGGEFTVPQNCMGESCDYRVTYSFDEETGDITFTVMSKISDKEWGGIGFSSDGGMIGSDAVLAWPTDNGMYEIKDMTLEGKRPSDITQDNMQDISNAQAMYENGWLTMEFTRKQNTGDSQDKIMDEDNCVYFLMPHSGGSVNGQQLSKHKSTPRLSSQVCIQSCKDVGVPMTTPVAGDGGSGSIVTASLMLMLFTTLLTFLNME